MENLIKIKNSQSTIRTGSFSEFENSLKDCTRDDILNALYACHIELKEDDEAIEEHERVINELSNQIEVLGRRISAIEDNSDT